MTTARMDAVDDPHGRERKRYSAVSIALHWTIAALIFLQLGLGWYFNEVLPDHSPAQSTLEGLHVEIGLTVMLLVVVRIVSRLIVPVPALPKDFVPWESALARTVHVLFYVLMVVLTMSGWLMVSLRHGPIHFWGLNFPHMPGLAGVSGPQHKAFGHAVKHFHVFTQIWIAVALIFLHVAGAIKHQFDGHPILWRMLPLLREPPER